MAKIEDMKVEVSVEMVESGTIRVKKKTLMVFGGSMAIVSFLFALVGACIGDILRFLINA